MRLPIEKCLMEEEEPSQVFDFYDMVCTLDCEDCEGTEEETLCEEAIQKTQATDPFCIAMVQMIQTEGRSPPRKKEMAWECRRWLPHLEARGGVLYRVKAGTKKARLALGDHEMLQQWVPAGKIRKGLLETVHSRLGHAGRDRTFQPLHDKFYWSGMYAAVERHCALCVDCQMHAPKPIAAPMQGHVEADKPGEYVAMDIVHMAEVNGYKCMLTMKDVHSRCGMAIELMEISAAAVQRAVEDLVVPGGFGGATNG